MGESQPQTERSHIKVTLLSDLFQCFAVCLPLCWVVPEIFHWRLYSLIWWWLILQQLRKIYLCVHNMQLNNFMQLKLAKSVLYNFTVNETQKVVKYKEKSYFVSFSDNTCSCCFMKTMLMPCHHLLAARTHVGITTFEPFLVVKRWCKEHQLHIEVKLTNWQWSCWGRGRQCWPFHAAPSCGISTASLNKTFSNPKWELTFQNIAHSKVKCTLFSNVVDICWSTVF